MFCVGSAHAASSSQKVAKVIWRDHTMNKADQTAFMKRATDKLARAGIQAEFSPSLRELEAQKGPHYGFIRITVRGAKTVGKAYKLIATKQNNRFVDNYSMKNRPNMISSEYGTKGHPQFTVGTRTGYAQYSFDQLGDDS
jgi:hypothetical protein